MIKEPYRTDILKVLTVFAVLEYAIAAHHLNEVQCKNRNSKTTTDALKNPTMDMNSHTNVIRTKIDLGYHKGLTDNKKYSLFEFNNIGHFSMLNLK